MSPAVFVAFAALMAASVECAAAQSSVHLPPSNDGRLDFVLSSEHTGNRDRYSAQNVDRDHITSNGYYTAYRSPLPLPAQPQIEFPYGRPARIGVARAANAANGVPVSGLFRIYVRVPSLVGGTLTESPLRVEFVASPQLGTNVTMVRDSNNGLIVPDCVFDKRRDGDPSVVAIVCGRSSSPTSTARPARA